MQHTHPHSAEIHSCIPLAISPEQRAAHLRSFIAPPNPRMACALRGSCASLTQLWLCAWPMVQVEVHRDGLRAELRLLRDDIHRLTLELRERTTKVCVCACSLMGAFGSICMRIFSGS